MEEIRELVLSNKFVAAKQNGTVKNIDIGEDYAKRILSIVDINKIKPSKIVVDASNGMGGLAFDLVFKDLPLEIIRMYFEPDGSFPNHGGDPLQEENTLDLQHRVKEEGADKGFIFDPDADRFFVVDSRGRFISGDFSTALMGRYYVQKNRGAAVIYDTRSSWAVRDLINDAGGKPIEFRVGHAYIKPKMSETKAVFGGEVSGHFYFPDFYFADSGVLASLLLLAMLGEEEKELDELMDSLFKKYFISGEINSKVKNSDGAISKIEEIYKETNEIYYMDGISIVGENWHANIRKSNTEPLLRLNVEGMSSHLMETKRDELLKIIQAY